MNYLEVLSNLTNEPLEGKFTDQKLGGLLIPSDLAQSDCARAETMRLLHTASSGLQ
jgi:hypothetical protein